MYFKKTNNKKIKYRGGGGGGGVEPHPLIKRQKKNA